MAQCHTKVQEAFCHDLKDEGLEGRHVDETNRFSLNKQKREDKQVHGGSETGELQVGKKYIKFNKIKNITNKY